jgi:DNA (cytosine-5)-methyltransferase 1
VIVDAAYYNEFDKGAAAWLRELIKAGLIAPGEVDERSIEDVEPADLRGFTQCHFFAGIGVWSHALRRAGWPDSRPIWTGSCPCQPFSAAGQGAGLADERHLWPAFYHLIDQLRPAIIVGEQVASKAADPWIDLVHADMEALDYAFGAVAFPSAGVGAPHIRDRTYWVADAQASGGLADAAIIGLDRGRPGDARDGHHAPRIEPQRLRAVVGLDDADGARPQGHAGHGGAAGRPGPAGPAAASGVSDGEHGLPGPVNGHWSDADWLFCRDGKWRPVESGTFPLAHGVAARVGRLRGYGNAINAEAARVFIESIYQGG